MACSSANISRSVLAMWVARLEEDEDEEGIWFGV
jgi:hypothetical protein